MPCARKVSAGAVLTFSDSASAGVMLGKSISARKGSPSADCTVTEPKASAKALGMYSATDASTAAASAEYFQLCMEAIDLKGWVLSQGDLSLFMVSAHSAEL